MAKKYYLTKRKKKKMPKGFKKNVMKVIDKVAELKFTEQVLTLLNATNTLGITPLISGNTQDTTDTGHIGDEIILKDVIFSFQVGQPIATAAGIKDNHSVRLFIIQWFGSQVPVNTDILQTVTTTNIALSMFNMDNHRQFFNVLYDRTFYVGDFGSKQITGVMNHRLNMKKVRKHVTYRAAAATPVGNCLYVCQVSDFGAAVGEIAPIYNFRSRVTYHDL